MVSFLSTALIKILPKSLISIESTQKNYDKKNLYTI
jgi:hypothetical protein